MDSKLNTPSDPLFRTLTRINNTRGRGSIVSVTYPKDDEGIGQVHVKKQSGEETPRFTLTQDAFGYLVRFRNTQRRVR